MSSTWTSIFGINFSLSLQWSLPTPKKTRNPHAQKGSCSIKLCTFKTLDTIMTTLTDYRWLGWFDNHGVTSIYKCWPCSPNSSNKWHKPGHHVLLHDMCFRNLHRFEYTVKLPGQGDLAILLWHYLAALLDILLL